MYRTITKIFSLLSAGFGLFALSGWLLKQPLLTAFSPNSVPMAPSTALFFVILGSVLFFHSHVPKFRTMDRCGLFTALISIVVSTVLLLSSSLQKYSELEWLGLHISGSHNGIPIGHMSPLTAFCFLIAAVSLLLLARSGTCRIRAKAALLFATLILVLAFVLLVGYLIGGPLLYGSSLIPPALTTALAFLSLGIALLASAIVHVWPNNHNLDAESLRRAYILSLVFILLATSIIATGALYFRKYHIFYRTEVENELSAMSQFKVQDILHWRQERVNDAALFTHNDEFTNNVRAWLASPETPDKTHRLHAWMGKLLEQDQYDQIMLVDTQLQKRLSLPPSSEPMNANLVQSVSTVLHSGRITFQDFQRNPRDHSIRLSVLVPIIDTQNNQKPLGVLVLRVDPSVYLYPSLDRWSNSHHSPETWLIRREGDYALYVSNLAQQKNTALAVRVSISQLEIPSVQAVLGHEGIIEGTSYQGKRGIADIRAIPDSPWFLVSFIGINELHEPLQKRFLEIMGLIGFFLIGAGLIFAWLWREQRLLFYKAQIDSAEKLQKRNQDFELALQVSRMGDWNWNILTGDIVWSDQCKALYGLPPETVIDYDTFLNAVHPDDLQRVTASLEEAVKSKKPYELEKRSVWPDGSIHWNATQAQVFCNDAGEPVYMVGMTYDITERKQLEMSLERAEKTLRVIFKDAFDGIVVADAITTKFLMANEAFCKDLGYSHDEVLTLCVADIHPEAYMPTVMDDFSKQRSLTLDLPVQRKDGSCFYADISSSAIDIEGRTCLVGIFRDITERKKAEAERERLFMAIEQSIETIMITDLEGNIQYVNPAFEKITGYTKEEALGKNPRLLKSDQQDESFYENLWQKLSRGEIWEGRLVNKKKNGELYTEDVVISPIRDTTGTIINYVAVKHDVTEHLKVQEEKDDIQSQLLQSQKLEAIGRLAGGVAHDFNNIIMVIRGYSDLVMRSIQENDKLANDVQQILNAADRAALLTRQLLAFARKETVQPMVLDVNNVVANMLKMLQRLISEEIELVWKPSPHPCPVKIDPSQMDQILANLAVNAHDAIDGVGELAIETFNVAFDEEYCSFHVDFIPGNYVCLAVSDNGCGMDKQTIKNIFDPFFTTKEMGKGTGLGLSTVFGIVKQSEGFINVYSEPEQGTTFRIYLPYIDTGEGPLPVEHQPQKAIRQTGVETVLFVDDEQSILDIGQRILNELGYTVIVAKNPSDAIQQINNHSDIELLITDIIMPEMNGKELFNLLVSKKPSLKCLYMSGYTADIITKHGLHIDEMRLIAKPFSIDELAIKIRDVLDK